jgi:glycosyltransferase involved in cell wall biosynthesis
MPIALRERVMQVHQFVTSLAYGDAIGNHALAIQRFLRQQGISSELFVDVCDPRCAHLVKHHQEYERYSQPGHIALFHFSISSALTEKFLAARAKKVLIYHNITPAHFFLDFHSTLARYCHQGRNELAQLAKRVDLALGVSEFNRQELLAAGFPRTGTAPLIIDFSSWDIPVSPVLADMYADGKVNVAYLGRIAPVKKIEDLLKTFSFFQRSFHAESRLFIIGENREFLRYLASLQRLASALQLRHVIFTGQLQQEDMVSLLKLSHLYLHLSEHEGFCAPLLECFHAGIPVLAYAAGAVAETMNGGGILLWHKDLPRIAALLDELQRRPDWRERIIVGQHNALQRFRPEAAQAKLLDYLRQLDTS